MDTDGKGSGGMYDLIIIGAGTAGYVAALYAARAGLKVALAEKDEVGGVCLNRGCIPSKALISSAEALEEIGRAKEFGIRLEGRVFPDFALIMERKDRVVEMLRKGVESLLQVSKVEVYRGEARLLSSQQVQVRGEVLEGRNLLLATGSAPADLPGFTIDGRKVLSSDHLLSLKEIPPRLLILGAGSMGCEFGFLFNTLGSEVTIVELLPRVLPGEDKDVSRLVEREMRRRKINLFTGTKVEGMEEENGVVRLYLPGGEVIEGDILFLSVGRSYNSGGFGLEELGVKRGSKGEILVDWRMRTSVQGVYAAGDVIGGLLLAHVASAEGITAVDDMLGRARPLNYDCIPWGIFTKPEVGRVGLTEEQARDRYEEILIGRFPYRAAGRAIASGEITGEAKIIARKGTEEVVGAHIVGAFASDLVQEVSIAMQAGIRVGELRKAVFAHPTFSEVVKEALEDLEGFSLHQFPRKSK